MALNTKNVFGTGRHLAILGNDKRISMVFILIACGISLAADIILFIVIHRSNQKEKLNEELKLKEYQNRLNLEYYKSAEENALEARKIRHDLANVVEIMSALLESGEKENKQRADELMQQLKMSISDIHVEKYSENSLVNAIIANKAAACRNNNVTAEFNINVPETLNVEEIDVCKAYVNVIDNAMNAASQLEGEDRKLQIDSYVNNGYLYIKSMNKSNEEKKKEPNKLHGYGQKILQDIAGKYSGKFITDFENNLYSALLTMKV
jgi:two-component system sensor histidine kinase AgrC